MFAHRQRDVTTSVYGDDFTTAGRKSQLDWFKKSLEERYELNELARLGPGANDDKEAKILNRIVRWTETGIEYEADPRQLGKLLRDLNLDDGVKSASAPGVKMTAEGLAADEPLAQDKHTAFRAVAARCNYLAADRPDCQYAAKEICRWMSSPTEGSLAALKRLGRYLVEARRVVYRYEWQSVTHIDVYTDTDWAGCPKTRRSTSGGGLVVGSHLIKSWSTTQADVALSSGEAEYYGAVKAGGIGLGYQSLLRDLGLELGLRVWTGSTATIGICNRDGLGKLRHIDTQCLWLQHQVRGGKIDLRKVKGTENPADVFTKHLPGNGCIEALLGLFSCDIRGGRPAAAPKLRQAEGQEAGEQLQCVKVAYALGLEGDAEAFGGSGGELLQVGDHQFPAVWWEGGWVPEAKSYAQTVLPHRIGPAMEETFPRATVCKRELLDDFDQRMSELETEGQRLGQIRLPATTVPR